MGWYTYDRRKSALEHIAKTSVEIIRQEGASSKRAAGRAWRRAVETWLLQEGIIAIEKGGSVTPNPSLSVSYIWGTHKTVKATTPSSQPSTAVEIRKESTPT